MDEKTIGKLANALYGYDWTPRSKRRAANRLAEDGSPAAAVVLAKSLLFHVGGRAGVVARAGLARLTNQASIDAVCQQWCEGVRGGPWMGGPLDEVIAEQRWVATGDDHVRVRTALHAQRLEVLANGNAAIATELLSIVKYDFPYLRERAATALATLRCAGAREVVCAAAIEGGNVVAMRAALDGGFQPERSAWRALLLFMSDNDDAYTELDLDGSLLREARTSAHPDVRTLLAQHARRTGGMAWVRSATPFDDALLDDEWTAVREILAGGRHWAELLRAAQAAPLAWAVRMLEHVAASGWLPAKEPARTECTRLVQVAAECADHPEVVTLAPAPLNDHGKVRCLTTSPDGRLLAAGNDNGDIRLWELPSGKAVQRIRTTVGPVTSLALSSGGLVIASGPTGLGVWYVSGKAAAEPVTADVRCLAVSPDGQLLVTGEKDGPTRVWRLPSLAPVATLSKLSTAHDVVVTAHPKGTLVAAVLGNRVRSWTLRPDDDRWPLVDHGWMETAGWVPTLAPMPDGSVLAAVDDGTTVHLWGGDIGPATLTGAGATAQPDLSQWIRWTPYEETRPTPRRRRNGSDCLAVCGTLIASRGTDGMTRLWRLPSGMPVGRLIDETAGFTCLATTPDGGLLATGTDLGAIHLWHLPSTIRLGHLPSLESAGTLTGHNFSVTCLTTTPTGLLASASADGSVRLWQPRIAPLASESTDLPSLPDPTPAEQPWLELSTLLRR